MFLKMIFAWRYRRWWCRWRGNPLGPYQPSPFFAEQKAYLIAKNIRDRHLRSIKP